MRRVVWGGIVSGVSLALLCGCQPSRPTSAPAPRAALDAVTTVEASPSGQSSSFSAVNPQQQQSFQPQANNRTPDPPPDRL